MNFFLRRGAYVLVLWVSGRGSAMRPRQCRSGRRPLAHSARRLPDLAAERTGLGKSEMVGIRGLAAAHETRLLGDVAQVLPVAIAPRGSDREDALVDALRLIWVGAFSDGIQLRPFNLRRVIVRECSRI